MKGDYRIHINFLAVDGSIPHFTIFRMPRLDGQIRPVEATKCYSFPRASDPDDRAFFWVRTTSHVGFEPYTASATENNDLTKWMLFQALRESILRQVSDDGYILPKRGFLDEISLVMATHDEGKELLVLQPYLLRETAQFGYLADFHFLKDQGVPFSRRVQQLSLSLDRQHRRNLDYYLDRWTTIRSFVAARAKVLEGLRMPGAKSEVTLHSDFACLPARRLRSKSYVFGNNRESRSQFTGLRDHGPLQCLDRAPHLVFMFREQDRIAARSLAVALRGSKGKERFSFPGFHALFKCQLDIDGDPIVLADLSEQAMTTAFEKVRSRCEAVSRILPVLVLPEGDENGYLQHKAAFAHAGIPTQVCTLPVIQDENALKWAIANIALQIFCKSGGQPWKVRPTTEPTLIIGVSQSHKLQRTDQGTRIEKYFAFTVMTDNSGLFQRIQVLGEGQDKHHYLRQLGVNLRSILSEASERFSRVVVHTSFKLKQEEIREIEKIVIAAAAETPGSCRFAVVKVNHKCRFFGINRQVNSLVPFEGTAIRLGSREHLVWFEGIFPDRLTVTKAFPGPTHLQFLSMTEGAGISDDELIQDVVNLSGANWRGFNAKSAPVSVFYCHLVADLVHDFHERGLPLPQVQVIRPWFL